MVKELESSAAVNPAAEPYGGEAVRKTADAVHRLVADGREKPADFYEGFRDVLEYLKPEDRDLLILRYGEELSLQAIGDRNGKTREWARQRINTILRHLRMPPCWTFIRRGRAAGMALLEANVRSRSPYFREQYEELKEKDPMKLPVRWIDVSTRCKNALTRNGLQTLQDCVNYLEMNNGGLCRLPGVGPTMESELLQAMFDLQTEGETK